MRTIFIIIRKEFIQVFRDKTMLPMIFLMPIVQLLILVNAATMEMKNIEICVVDKDLSQDSRNLVSKLEASPFFNITYSTFDVKEAENQLKKDRADLVLVIPQGFEKSLLKENQAEIQLLINAINGTVASLANVYATNVISSYNSNIRTKYLNLLKPNQIGSIKVIQSFWYNPELDYKIYMLPGILVILVTAIGMVLTAINLVREKEMGTIEQINVTPIKRYQFIIGKLLPFWVIALFELALGILIGWILYDTQIIGSVALLFGFAAIYLLAVLGLGLFISTLASSQQQVMLISFFFLLVFILMSGIFTPVESMPDWAIKANIINPVSYFMKAIRMIMLKGSGINDIRTEMIYLSLYAVLILSLAVGRYRKVV